MLIHYQTIPSFDNPEEEGNAIPSACTVYTRVKTGPAPAVTN